MKIDEHDNDWNERLQDMLDGELESSAQAEFDTHVASCTRCREKLRQFERMDEALQAAAPPISLDSSFDARLFAQIDEARFSFSGILDVASPFPWAELAALENKHNSLLEDVLHLRKRKLSCFFESGALIEVRHTFACREWNIISLRHIDSFYICC